MGWGVSGVVRGGIRERNWATDSGWGMRIWRGIGARNRGGEQERGVGESSWGEDFLRGARETS